MFFLTGTSMRSIYETALKQAFADFNMSEETKVNCPHSNDAYAACHAVADYMYGAVTGTYFVVSPEDRICALSKWTSRDASDIAAQIAVKQRAAWKAATGSGE